MTLHLPDIPIICVSKEFEIAHLDYIGHMNSRTSTRNDELYGDLLNAVQQLGFEVRCSCHDTSCRYWESDRGRCGCDRSLLCRSLLFQTRESIFNPSSIEEPSSEEIEMQRARIPESEKARKEGEYFIVWKARVDGTVYRRARELHNYRDEGYTSWTYTNWTGDNNITSDVAQTSFRKMLLDIRATPEGHEGNTITTEVVGCSACGMVFEREAQVLKHVDRLRTLGNRMHVEACIVTPTSNNTRVRATPSSYVLPTLDDEGDSLSRILRGRTTSSSHVYRYIRTPSESDADFESHVQERVTSMRISYPRAVGCLRCGKIYRNASDFTTHFQVSHPNIGNAWDNYTT